MKEKVVYTRWIACELRKQGFPIVRVERNPNKPELFCWVFEETQDFLLAFANIANSR